MKKLLTIVFACTTLFTQAQIKEPHKSIIESLEKKEKYQDIINYINTNLKNDTANFEIVKLLGFSYLFIDDVETGIKYYEKALKLDPTCLSCYKNLTNSYIAVNNAKTALIMAKKAVELAPADSTVYGLRARAYWAAGYSSMALLDFNKAIETAPNNPYVYGSRADFYLQQNNYTAAMQDLNKAVEVGANLYSPYYQRATLYYNLGKIDDALADMNKAIAIDSTQTELYIGRGTIYAAKNMAEEALRDNNKTIALSPNNITAYYNRALTYYMMEDMDNACIDYNIVIKLAPLYSNTDTSLVPLAKMAVADFCDATKPSYYYQRGIANYNLGKYNQAIQHYNDGLQKFESNAMLLNFKGNALMKLDNYTDALTCYNQTIANKENAAQELKNNPRFANASTSELTRYSNNFLSSTYMSMAECYYYLNDFSSALKNINKGIELGNPADDINIETYYNIRGQINLATKNFDDAIADFNKAISFRKDYSIAYVNKAVCSVAKTEKQATFKNGNWILAPFKKKKDNAVYTAALADCDTAIMYNPSNGYAYYIRGQIKMSLGYADGCADLQVAQTLGIVLPGDLANYCK